MRIRPYLSLRHPLLTPRDLILHQRLILHVLLIPFRTSIPPPSRLPYRVLVSFRRLSPHPPRLLQRLSAARRPFDSVLMHRFQRARHPQEQDHQPPLRELGMINEIGIDGILQVPPSIVR